jgi:hypothetical protein
VLPYSASTFSEAPCIPEYHFLWHLLREFYLRSSIDVAKACRLLHVVIIITSTFDCLLTHCNNEVFDFSKHTEYLLHLFGQQCIVFWTALLNKAKDETYIPEQIL